MSGTVYLVGAGCGDPDLITLRGRDRLLHCDAVVYDALIDPRLLDFAPHAEKFSAGKRAGGHSMPQEEINALLVSLAAAGKNVVRLKGGDPFVFGRGGEEIQALQAAGIPFETVPGVSAAIAVPEHAGIPVTHRNLSRSVHIITAHTAGDSPDFAKYASLDGTLLFFMGLAALPEIAAGLMRGGMKSDTPAAVISQGATQNQQVVRANLCDIAEKSRGLSAPALIVVGQTAAFDFSATAKKPLSGVRVTVAGTASFLDGLSRVLQPLGADVTAFQALRIVPNGELPDLTDYACMVLTSPSGAECFLSACKASRLDLRRLSGVKLAVIGRSTGDRLASAGIYPDLIPERADSQALAGLIAQNVSGKVLLLRAKNGSPVLPDALKSAGVDCVDFPLYDTVSAISEPVQIDTDYIVFGSVHGAECFFAAGCTLSPETVAVCTGKRAVSLLRERGCTVLESEPRAEQIAAALIGATAC